MTRDELRSLRDAAQEARRRPARALATWSVGLGLGQLALLRYLDATFPAVAKPVELVVFMVYAAGVVWLLARLRRVSGAGLLRCPACEQEIAGLSARIAMACGRCDRCGAEVLTDTGDGHRETVH